MVLRASVQHSTKNVERNSCRSRFWRPFFAFVYPLLVLEILAESVFGALQPSFLERFVEENFPQSDGNATILLVNGVTSCVSGALTAGSVLLLGSVSDIIGRKPVIFVAVIGASLPYLSALLAQDTLWLYIVFSGVSGIFGSTNSFAFSYVADTVLTKWRTIAFGLVNACFGVSFLAGSFISASIIESFPDRYSRVTLLVVLSLLAAAALYSIIIPESKTRSKDEEAKREKWLCCCCRRRNTVNNASINTEETEGVRNRERVETKEERRTKERHSIHKHETNTVVKEFNLKKEIITARSPSSENIYSAVVFTPFNHLSNRLYIYVILYVV